jgi:alkanesulfonate monooxygenase SsuD/methylene tetrahydromethanopterin reductase-like flavin-dependent oxidoreductase (luciferase family)
MSDLLDRLGVVTLPYAVPQLVDIARGAERCGYSRVGMADSPILYGEIYPSITMVLSATSRIQIGPNVTNPVSRHWTVHAASARTIDAVYPGRFFLGLAAGDGAVHTVGLRPASRDQLAAAAQSIRENVPESVEIHMASSGPKSAETAGSVGDVAIVATGSDTTALSNLAVRARASAGGNLPVWGLVYVDVVPPTSSVKDALQRALPIAMSMSRFSLAQTFDEKNVPNRYQATFRKAMSAYDFMHHASDDVNPNVLLIEEDPEVRDYICQRFCIVGDAAHCLERLSGMIDESGIDGVWMAMGSSDPVGNLERLASAT